jgi:hemerythrin-like domain-containing protein
MNHLLKVILAQHDALRAIMVRCETLADEVDAGREAVMRLTREVARLRSAFKAHNRAEEQMFETLGHRDRSWFAAHVADHSVVGSRLGSSITGELRVAIESIRTHLAHEERVLFANMPALLAPDLDEVEGRPPRKPCE